MKNKGWSLWSKQSSCFPGVSLRGVTTGRFKSACLSCSFLRPLCRSEAAKKCPPGQRADPGYRCTPGFAEHFPGAGRPVWRKPGASGAEEWGNPDLGLLPQLFGGPVCPGGGPGFGAYDGAAGEVLLRPRLVGGALDPDYVGREKENLISTIETSLNDKRVYAGQQMLRAMCRDDGFGVPGWESRRMWRP